MADQPDDLLSRYYAEKFWEMIPPVYRSEDGSADNPGVLRAFVEVLSEQAAIVRRSNDRLWDDQFIDSCDDWAVPYIGDLLGTRMVSALDLRARRVDVANTISYRRRAGTLGVLEGLVSSITGWEGTAVEEFQRLLRYPHGLDPAPARTGRFTNTPAHGLPDMRNPRGSSLTTGPLDRFNSLSTGPWDEFNHLPDVRQNHGGIDGRYGISKLAFHLYRLGSLGVVRSTPFLLQANAGQQRFTFDPTGRAIPLFQRHNRPEFGLDWRAALEWEMPAPIKCEVLADAEFEITEALILSWAGAAVITATAANELRSIRGIRFPNEGRFRTRLGATLSVPLGLAALHRVLADALVSDCGKGVLLPIVAPGPGDTSSIRVEDGAATVARELTVAGNLTSGTPTPADKSLVIDAENGIGFFTAGAPPANTVVSYRYGFSGPTGAGTFDRSGLAIVAPAHTISGGGIIAAPAPTANAELEIDDSATYGPIALMSVQASLLIQAANGQRPYVDINGTWSFVATQADSVLTIDGIWFGSTVAPQVVLAAAPNCGWKSVTLRHVTLDPGGTDADGNIIPATLLTIASRVDELVIDSCILGYINELVPARVGTCTMTNSIVQGATPGLPVAIWLRHGRLDVRGSTVIGFINTHQIEASELLCVGYITVDDLQSGCVRFSAYFTNSSVPKAYRTFTFTDASALFTSLRFGDPGYAQLSNVAPDEIARGGENGTEIGAFNTLLNPIKLDSLRAKIDEFLPFGMTPMFITET